MTFFLFYNFHSLTIFSFFLVIWDYICFTVLHIFIFFLSLKEWKASVETIKTKLHTSFSKYMEKLQYKGEVQLRMKDTFMDWGMYVVSSISVFFFFYFLSLPPLLYFLTSISISLSLSLSLSLSFYLSLSLSLSLSLYLSLSFSLSFSLSIFLPPSLSLSLSILLLPPPPPFLPYSLFPLSPLPFISSLLSL